MSKYRQQVWMEHDEAELLVVLIDNWLEGLPQAAEETEKDRTFEQPEHLLDVLAGYQEQRELLTKMREKVAMCL